MSFDSLITIMVAYFFIFCRVIQVKKSIVSLGWSYCSFIDFMVYDVGYLKG